MFVVICLTGALNVEPGSIARTTTTSAAYHLRLNNNFVADVLHDLIKFKPRLLNQILACGDGQLDQRGD